MLIFYLDPHSGVAPYFQLVQQVKQALRLGHLLPGDQLPTVKEVVTHLTINPNTVLKAYRELEIEGIVGGRPGQGTFVLKSLTQIAPETLSQLRQSLNQWLHSAKSAGLTGEDIKALFENTLHEEEQAGVV